MCSISKRTAEKRFQAAPLVLKHRHERVKILVSEASSLAGRERLEELANLFLHWTQHLLRELLLPSPLFRFLRLADLARMLKPHCALALWAPPVLPHLVGVRRWAGLVRVGQQWFEIRCAVRYGCSVPGPLATRYALHLVWVSVEKPELQIIDRQLWDAVQARFRKKKTYGRKSGRGRQPKYLLSGFRMCSICGGPIPATNSKHGKQIIKVYGCAYHRDRRTTSCASDLARHTGGG